MGLPSPMTQRLTAISTQAPSQYVRRYELAFVQSAATNRSLLTSIKLCGGQACGTEQLPATTFQYQQDLINFSDPLVMLNGQMLGTEWNVALGRHTNRSRLVPVVEPGRVASRAERDRLRRRRHL